MKLFYTKRSPYARKARMVAREKQITLEEIEEDLTKKTKNLLEANPLGKIPALILDDGETLCDSPVICEYLDTLNDRPVLIARDKEARFQTLHLAAIADGLMDAAVAGYMEKIRHPQGFHEQFVKSQEESIDRTFAFLNQHVGEFRNLSYASIAIACAIGYVHFRLPHLFVREKYSRLAVWFDEFSKRPSMVLTMPG